MLACLAILGHAALEPSTGRVHDQQGDIGLGCTCDHVFDEIPVSRGIDYRKAILGALKLPEGNVNGDPPFPFGSEVVQNPRVFERSLAHFSGFLFILFDGSLVDTSALVDQVTRRGGFPFDSHHVFRQSGPVVAQHNKKAKDGSNKSTQNNVPADHASNMQFTSRKAAAPKQHSFTSTRWLAMTLACFATAATHFLACCLSAATTSLSHHRTSQKTQQGDNEERTHRNRRALSLPN